MKTWSPTSWQSVEHQPSFNYPDPIALENTLNELNMLPPLIKPQEIIDLKLQLKLVEHRKAFIIQGGDCAERFEDCHPQLIQEKAELLLELSHILQQSFNKPIITIGRIAGQYSKPRSHPFETQQGLALPSYQGDLINALAFTEAARTPNPAYLLQGYHCAAKTLQYLPKSFSTSHEALHLQYEQALTRLAEDKWYNLSTHLPWLGFRTGQLHGAQVEFLRGIENPIGIKIGPNATAEWLLALLQRLNPKQESGKILLITRFGHKEVASSLPPLIKAVQQQNLPVIWCCDPMHGNAEMTHDGIKTRHFNKILFELQSTQHLHETHGSYLGGMHLELTPEAVTECLGGPQGLQRSDLKNNYKSVVDPRLNDIQARGLIHHWRFLTNETKILEDAVC